jgi:hypothetical protein
MAGDLTSAIRDIENYKKTQFAASQKESVVDRKDSTLQTDGCKGKKSDSVEESDDQTLRYDVEPEMDQTLRYEVESTLQYDVDEDIQPSERETGNGNDGSDDKTLCYTAETAGSDGIGSKNSLRASGGNDEKTLNYAEESTLAYEVEDIKGGQSNKKSTVDSPSQNSEQDDDENNSPLLAPAKAKAAVPAARSAVSSDEACKKDESMHSDDDDETRPDTEGATLICPGEGWEASPGFVHNSKKSQNRPAVPEAETCPIEEDTDDGEDGCGSQTDMNPTEATNKVPPCTLPHGKISQNETTQAPSRKLLSRTSQDSDNSSGADGPTIPVDDAQATLAMDDGPRLPINDRQATLPMNDGQATLSMDDGATLAMNDEQATLAMDDGATLAMNDGQATLSMDDGATLAMNDGQATLAMDDGATLAMNDGQATLAMDDGATLAMNDEQATLAMDDGATLAMNDEQATLAMDDGATLAMNDEQATLAMDDGATLAMNDGQATLSIGICPPTLPISGGRTQGRRAGAKPSLKSNDKETVATKVTRGRATDLGGPVAESPRAADAKAKGTEPEETASGRDGRARFGRGQKRGREDGMSELKEAATADKLGQDQECPDAPAESRPKSRARLHQAPDARSSDKRARTGIAVVKEEPTAAQPAVKKEGAAAKPAVKEEGAAAKPAVKKEGAAAKPAVKKEGAAAKPAVKEEGAAAKPAVEEEPDDVASTPSSAPGSAGRLRARAAASPSKGRTCKVLFTGKSCLQKLFTEVVLFTGCCLQASRTRR